MPIELILNEFVNTQGGTKIPLSTNVDIALTHLATILCHIMVDINDFPISLEIGKLHSKKFQFGSFFGFFFFFFTYGK